MIARLQMARGGAVGQCVQKVAEAEILAWGGVPDILVSNEVVGARKLARLAALSRIARVAVCADDVAQVAAYEAAAEAAGIRLDVLVEIDVGGGRCGVEPGPPAVALAERIAASPHLRFGGLQAYHGSAQHRRAPAEREAAIGGAIDSTRRTVEQLRQRGLACAIVGGAGTGTFPLEAGSGVFTEIQAGSYAFMDGDYARNEAPPPFRQSLFVLATVMSRAVPGVAAVDAGHKAVAVIPACPRCGGGPVSATRAPPTSTGRCGSRMARRRRSARSCGWCRAIATRRSIATAGMSGCAMAGWSAFGRSPPAARCSETLLRRPEERGGDSWTSSDPAATTYCPWPGVPASTSHLPVRISGAARPARP